MWYEEEIGGAAKHLFDVFEPAEIPAQLTQSNQYTNLRITVDQNGERSVERRKTKT